MKKKIILLLAMVMILGIPMVSFGGNLEITKSEFLKEVFEAAKIEVITEDTSLEPFVETAYEKGIISEEEKLKADKPVTKEEAVVILVKVFGERTRVKYITQEMIDEEIQFTDKKGITPEAKPYITYAIEYDMIDKDDKAFYPLMVLSEKTSKDMIQDAKKAHEKHFLRAGLSAAEMLEEADQKLKELKTYKTNGKLEADMKINIEGLPAEDGVGEKFDESMNMDIQIDMQTANPSKIYMKQVSKSSVEGLDTEEAVEIFIDETAMYQRMSSTGDLWIKTDMSLLHNQMQSLQGNSPQDMATLSNEQLEFFKGCESYGMDEIIDGKEYYIIYMDVDKETYKKFIKEHAQGIIEASLEQQNQINALQEGEEIPVEMAKMLIEETLEKMDIESSYKIYIDKGTMTYKKMDVYQTVYMNMDDFIQKFAELNEEENADLSNIKIEMIINQKGEFNYYDFDGEVIFPVIEADDIFNLTE